MLKMLVKCNGRGGEVGGVKWEEKKCGGCLEGAPAAVP